MTGIKNQTGTLAMQMRINELGLTKSWLAAQLGISKGAVTLWKEVPHKHVHAVASLLKMKPEVLRPDMFKRP